MAKDTSRNIGLVEAREYKVMLKHALFWGDTNAQEKAVRKCWESLSRSVKAAKVRATGSPELLNDGKQRFVRFYDTKSHALYHESGYILRLRRPVSSESEWDVTLKFRDSDWVRAASQDFSARRKGKSKFEEDIKAHPDGSDLQFAPLFSWSADAETDKAPKTVGDAVSCYQGLAEQDLPKRSARLSLVRGFEAREAVFEGMKLVLFGNVEAECAIILWSRARGNPKKIVAAEFSARYELTKQAQSSEVASRMWQAFTLICETTKWSKPAGQTKTAFVYEAA